MSRREEKKRGGGNEMRRGRKGGGVRTSWDPHERKRNFTGAKITFHVRKLDM